MFRSTILFILGFVTLLAAGYCAWLYVQWTSLASDPALSPAAAALLELSSRRAILGALGLSIMSIALWVVATRGRNTDETSR